MRSLILYLFLAVWAGESGLARTAAENNELFCARSARFLASSDASAVRQYAPDREVQVQHLALDITPDFQRRAIQGRATLRFKPLAQPVQEIKLDAVELQIRSVTASAKVQAYQVTEEQVIVTFAAALLPGQETTVTVTYAAEPTQGLYFRTPEMGYKTGDTHLFTQGEAIEARYWYPCLDSPNQCFTSEVICRVPAGMAAVSNGRLVSETKDPASGLTVIHWSQEKPHANYLVTLVAGYFQKLEGRCRDLPLAFYTPPSEFSLASNSFHGTKEMIAFFEQETGVAFPWAKYYQVCVNDFVAGGMENTSATTLTDRTLFTAATENIRTSEGLVAHELAHQWFGDLVTCKDWSHLWLNEGFATYYESLYEGHKHGREAMLYELYQRARQITGMTNDFTPIVRRTYNQPNEMFGYLVYPKAGWVLHMLRAQLGESLFRRCVQTYLQQHQFGNVVTEDYRAILEALSGRSFDQFFDQWLYHGHFPQLEVSYSWDEPVRLVRVSVRQAQAVNDKVLLFNLPLTVRFKGKFGTLDRTLQVSKKEEVFYVPLASAPAIVRVDPDYTLLAKISLNLPQPLLAAQLTDQTDMVGRLLAIEQLATKRDRDSLAKLKGVLNADAFYGVRLEAAKALRLVHTDEALEALLASTQQPDARVRREVVEAIGGFYAEPALTFARQVLEREKNPAIQAVALRDLGAYSWSEVRPLLLRFLDSECYRNELAEAAIAAMRLQDDPVYVAPLLQTLARRESQFTSRGFAQGLETLAYLARNEEKKDAVRDFLIGYVNHKKRALSVASLNALGKLGDPKALAVVEKWATAAKESPERKAAERAVAELRASRKPVDDFKNLREEVLSLQKANRDLRKELDELKKKVEAAQSGGNPKTEGRNPKQVRMPKSER